MPPLGLPIYGQPAPQPEAPKRWRSLAEAGGAADPAAGTYPDGDQDAPEAFGRRSFMQLLGASAALAGLSGCKPPREQVVSYVRRPADVTPSLPGYYATALSRGGHAVGLVVEAHEGRPTKIEGNGAQASSLGGAGLHELAAILDLYDPNRLAGVRRGGRPLAWSAFLREASALAARLEQDGGAGLRLLLEPSSSPTLAALRARLLARFPRMKVVAWDPVAEDAVRAGARLAFGRPLEPSYDLAAADVVLSLDADFLGTERDHLVNARGFASRRTQERMNRLYQAEAGYSVTGGVADHRLRMRAGEVLGFARAVCEALARSHGVAALAPLGAPASGERARQAAAVAKDLFASRGAGLVLAGRRQPAAVHAVAAALDAALGNVGATVTWREPSLLDPLAGTAGLAELARELEAGQVDTLVVTAWNPAFTAPADLGLAALLGKAKDVIYLAGREDETSRLAGTVVAASHPLESWGDLRGRDGTASIVQPLLAPLHQSVTELDLLGAFVEQGHLGAWRQVREGWRARSGAAAAGFDRAWEGWLAAGVVAGSGAPPVVAAVDVGAVAAAVAATPPPGPGLEACFAPDDKLLDGRFADNAWLQELPHPVSKLTWDNAAQLSPATAARLGLVDGDVVALSLRGRTVSAPVLVQPGHADDSVTLPLGYGRTVAGPVGAGVGFAAGGLRSAAAPWIDAGLEVKPTGTRHDLARTQEHFSMEGRSIALGYDVGRLPAAAHELEHHRGEQPSILPAVDYSKEEYRWGMTIDLSKCLGCGACTLACQAENNIPVVGKEQVLKSREMHWIRVDRYYEGTPADPTSVSQPLACVHCEAAPCEYVCPVNATVHSDEGLNEMVYNRCVGTRYCSNNCAYKVRRFNYLDYRGSYTPTIKMLQNPDVTVRSRGVMEKCTYCVQRIERVRIGARTKGEKVGGDAVVSACQQACPAEAIVFGNLNDPTARVTRLQQDERRYDLLHELGTRPRTAYLVRLKNPNPELA
ncbi:MAG: 4Fe-4S dicluster domain-containing protein [Anaeromyxobacter sp.]|nr:4Fe-4S dicluster domain-containing protein [Anaeromyxobacter sp.]